MSKKLQAVRGTVDLMGDEHTLQQIIQEEAQHCAALYNFESCATPIFESTDVYKRTLGESSDVVNKEMYTFERKEGESLTLRPEFTAGIARAFISNGWQQHLPLKLFSTGPLFRYERPQKGRQRQFHQVNYEWLGAAGPEVEVQMIALAGLLLEKLDIVEYTLELNTLGDDESRDSYRAALVEYLSAYKDELSDDSKTRLEVNPLRILDSKDSRDKEIVENAPKTVDYLSEHSKTHFEAVCAGLDMLGIDYNVNPKIVRGLDYYNDVVFEFISDDERIGAQSTILAGGRYDRLVGQMGGPATPAVGFAAGIERLELVTGIEILPRDFVAILPADDGQNNRAIELATHLRARGQYVELFMGGNFGKRMKKASAKGGVTAIILREGEEPTFKDIYEEKSAFYDDERAELEGVMQEIIKDLV
jgi:histidyl-tRNA synthetase